MSRVRKFKEEGRQINCITARDEFFVLEGEHSFHCMRLRLRVDLDDLFCDRCMLAGSRGRLTWGTTSTEGPKLAVG